MPRNSSRPVLGRLLDDEEDLQPVSSTSVVAFLPDRQGEVLPPFFNAGVRSEDLRPELRNEIVRVFGAAVLSDPVKAAAIQDVAREFRHQGTKVLSAVVAMGRSLIVLRRQIGMQALARGMRESKLIFCGCSQGNLSKMMRVAEFVDAGGYALDTLPQSLGTMYELATLDSGQMDQARAGDLLRPDITRSQLIEFKRRVLPSPSNPAELDVATRERLQASLKNLRKRLDRHLRQVKATETEIRDVEARLSPPGRQRKA